jgi:hypothetical protein
VVTLSAHQAEPGWPSVFGLTASLVILWTTIGNPALGFLVLVLAELVLVPASGDVHRRHRRHAPARRARTDSIVSASAAVLSGRYRSTRANRSATPPG